MALSPEEMNAIKAEQLGGAKAAELWNAALNALHAYAQESKALGGMDIVQWFEAKSEAYRTSLSAAIVKSAADARGERP